MTSFERQAMELTYDLGEKSDMIWVKRGAFALVGVLRLTGLRDSGAQLASTSGLRPGAAIDHVRQGASPSLPGRILILI